MRERCSVSFNSPLHKIGRSILSRTRHSQNRPNALPLNDVAGRTARPLQPLGEFDDFYLMYRRDLRHGDLNNVVPLRKPSIHSLPRSAARPCATAS